MTDSKLPEEFAPTGPKLSRFPIQPAPPIRPKLFADELRFAVRLSILVAATELSAWAAVGRALIERRAVDRPAMLWAVLGVALLRSLRPLWSRLGTRLPRPLVASALLLGALAVFCSWLVLPRRASGMPYWLALLALALPALADLAATAVADSITVERRAAAYSALDMGQALGAALGLGLGSAAGEGYLYFLPPLILMVSSAAVFDLHDRGTPRSSWTLAARKDAARDVKEPLAIAFLTGALGAAALALSAGSSLFGEALPLGSPWSWLCAPLAGMVLASRLEARFPSRALVLRGCLALAAAAFAIGPHGPDGLGGALALFALGGALAALPAAILRSAAEMDRAPASSLGFTALSLGAGLGALVALAAV